MLLVAHRAIPGTSLSRSVSGACVIERCSPWSVPFPPQPPRKLALLCSTGSQVLRHSPTSLVRACPLFGLWPLRTGLVLSNKTYERSPGSRACCFSACAGSQTTQDQQPLANSVAAVLPSSISEGSRHPDPSAFRSSIAPPTGTSGLRFTRHLTVPPARLEARMESLFSFPVGLFHPLQHAGLSRRTPVGRRPVLDSRNRSACVIRISAQLRQAQ